MKRKITKIDEDKCTGCELCIPNCPEGAIQIIDCKARLVSDIMCDGLGACLGHCPEDAITVIALIDGAKINTLTVLTMQVPCCSGLLHLAQEAAEKAERKITIKSIVISLQGEILGKE